MSEVKDDGLIHVRSEKEYQELLQHGADMSEDGGHGLLSINAAL